MKVWLVLALALIAPASAEAVDYYASPTGTNNATCSTTVPCDIAAGLSKLSAATCDTLWLKDGTYTGDRQMLNWPAWAPNKAGTSQACPLSVIAVNDGAVAVKGEYARRPFQMVNNPNWVIQGINTCCGGIIGNDKQEAFFIQNSGGTIVRRVVAWDGYINGNNNTALSYNNTSTVLFEDFAAFGTGRYVFEFGGYTTCR